MQNTLYHHTPHYHNKMASSSESTIAKAKSAYYQSKLGIVTILTLNNYLKFQTTVVLAFMAGG